MFPSSVSSSALHEPLCKSYLFSVVNLPRLSLQTVIWAMWQCKAWQEVNFTIWSIYSVMAIISHITFIMLLLSGDNEVCWMIWVIILSLYLHHLIQRWLCCFFYLYPLLCHSDSRQISWKLTTTLVSGVCKIWLQIAFLPVVPLNRCHMNCQAAVLLEEGLSGILIGLALSVISGRALYCNTGLCALIQLYI